MKVIRESEFNNVEDLVAEVKKNNSLKIALAEKESKCTELEIKYKNELDKITMEYENSIKRMENEYDLSKLKLTQEIEIKKINMEKEREVEILKTQQEVGKIRQEFLEKNYGDLKTEAGQAFDRSLKAVSIFLDKIQYKQTNSNQPLKIEQHDVNIQ